MNYRYSREFFEKYVGKISNFEYTAKALIYELNKDERFICPNYIHEKAYRLKRMADDYLTRINFEGRYKEEVEREERSKESDEEAKN